MAEWVAIGLTALLGALGFAAQWGWTAAKVSGLEKRQDETLDEVKGQRDDITCIKSKVSYLEGKFNGQPE